jgi:hypothetical protein
MKVGASSTSTLGLKYSTLIWNLNNINMNLASQQHQHKAGNIHHEDDISTASA